MSRTRYIKPDFFKDTTLGLLPREVRLFYVGLWTEIDKNGVCEFSPTLLKASLFPFDDDVNSGTILAWCGHLYELGRIRFGEHDGKLWLKVVNFVKHQNFHKGEREKYNIPNQVFEINGDFESTVLQRYKNGASMVLERKQHNFNFNSNFNFNDVPENKNVPKDQMADYYDQDSNKVLEVLEKHFNQIPSELRSKKKALFDFYRKDMDLLETELSDLVQTAKTKFTGDAVAVRRWVQGALVRKISNVA